jgi:hypothetical protein
VSRLSAPGNHTPTIINVDLDEDVVVSDAADVDAGIDGAEVNP